MSRLAIIGLLALLGLAGSHAAGAMTRIKDITAIQGVRANQLIGYGLVVGLNGTGDSLRNSPFTAQSLQSMLDQMGVNIRNANSRTRNIAAVLVTADLPPFAGPGSRIDVTVSSLGDATSLLGGSLVMTPLNGPDSAIYAVAGRPAAFSAAIAMHNAAFVDLGLDAVCVPLETDDAPELAAVCNAFGVRGARGVEAAVAEASDPGFAAGIWTRAGRRRACSTT